MMGLRARTITLVFALVTVGVVIPGIVTSWMSYQSALQEERRQMAEELDHASDSLSVMLDQLQQYGKDWGIWDDTYHFVRTRSPAYVKSNLTIQAFQSLKVDFMIYADTSGTVVYSRYVDHDTGVPKPVPPGLMRYLASGPKLLEQKDPEGSVVGPLGLPEGPVLLAAQPILRSDGEGPAAGTYIVGYFVDRSAVDERMRTRFITIDAFRADSRDLPRDVRRARTVLLRGRTEVVEELDRDTVAGYTLVRGLDGRPAMLLRVTKPRDQLDVVRTGLVRFWAVASGFIMVLLLTLGLALDSTVLRRLSRLSADVGDVALRGDPSIRIECKGNDEISDLGERINSMLAALERSRHQLSYLAAHDPLTMLYNRRRFAEEFARELDEQRRLGGHGAVLWFDLDHFKEVNDSLGHAAGDDLLRHFGAALRQEARSYSALARLGGDEFALILPHADEHEAMQAAKRLSKAPSAREFVVEGHEIRVGVSVGIVLYPQHGSTVAELMERADLALYHAKEAGRSTISMYSSDDEWHSALAQRMRWAERVTAALRTDGFVLYAQPIVSASSGAWGLYELLLRMEDGRGGFVPPQEFIPTAESLGLIRDIDRWVVCSAIDLIAAEQAAGRDTSFSCNLSGRAFTDPELLPRIRERFETTGASPSRLIIEMTETAAIADLAKAKEFIEAVRDIGCRFALDDFGSDESTFYYLKHLPVDVLKIDGSIVNNLVVDRSDTFILNAIVEMSRGLGIKTIAEYVDSQELLNIVRERGVDYAQGYHMGMPEPLSSYLGH